MRQLFITLLSICFFKAKPQNLPVSLNVLAISIVATLALLFVRAEYLLPGTSMLSLLISQVILLAIALWLLLTLFKKPERWLQSATALYGCSAVIIALTIPLIMFAGPADPQTGAASSAFAVIVPGIWYFSVIVYIFRETLEIKTHLALLIALVVEMSITMILMSAFGLKVV